MPYTSEQRKVLRRIKVIAAQRGASPKEVKAAIETGLVESNLRNLPGGDADSAGWRQERASLYKNPTNLDESIRRFFRETAAVKQKYGKAGDLAAAVQRPAAQYRGRYQQRSGEAQSLLGGPASSSSSSMSSRMVGGVDRSGERAALISQFIQGQRSQDPLDFALGLRGLQDTPGRKVTTPSSSPSKPKGRAPLLELFWQGQGGVDVKNGQKVPQGFVDGHAEHVHVASGPKTVLELGKLAQSMGLQVGENPKFGGVNPVHATNSFHYRGQAIDVSGDKQAMAHFAATVADRFGVKVRS